MNQCLILGRAQHISYIVISSSHSKVILWNHANDHYSKYCLTPSEGLLITFPVVVQWDGYGPAMDIMYIYIYTRIYVSQRLLKY